MNEIQPNPLQPHPLRAKINALRITQTDICDRTGLQPSVVSMILSGRLRPTSEEETALNIAVESIISEIKEAIK